MASSRAKTQYSLKYKQGLTEFNGLFDVSGSTITIVDAPGLVACQKLGSTGEYAFTGSENFSRIYEFHTTAFGVTSSLKSVNFELKSHDFTATPPVFVATLVSGTTRAPLTSGPPTAIRFGISWKAK